MKTVLVVVDDATTAALCRDALEMEGYLVRAAETARDGAEVIRKLRPDAALIDLGLPDGSGADLARTAREFGEVAVIVITGYGSEEAVIECLRAGVRDFIEKPVRPDRLVEAVKQALALKAAHEDARRMQALIPLFEVCERIGSTADPDLALDVALLAAMSQTGASGGFAVTRSVLSGWRPRLIRGLPLSARLALEKYVAAVLADVVDRSAQNVVLLNVRENPWLHDLFEKGEPADRHPEDYWLLCGSVGAATEGLGLLGVYGGPDPERLRKWGAEVLGIICRQVAAAAAAAQRRGALGLMQDEAIGAFGVAIDRRDPYMAGHSRLVAQVADQIAGAMHVSQDERQLLYRAAILHDIGMLAVPDAIIWKAASLEPEEIEAVRQHPVTGAEIVGEARSLRPVMPSVRHHHEWFDGNGYPDGLKGEDIPFPARILGVAEAYSAMVADRAYRPALAVADTLAELSAGAGTQFDPDIVAAFVSQVAAEQ